MNIAIFGMGYVGVVSAAALSRDGHSVVGVDVVASKVTELQMGSSPIQEPGVDDLVWRCVAEGRLRATVEAPDALDGADMVWICVGTPSAPDGDVDLGFVRHTAGQIGHYLKETDARPLIVVRSTVPPGSIRTVVVPALEAASGLRVGHDIHVVFHPEFLREGTALADFERPPKIVVGCTTDIAVEPLRALYRDYAARQFVVSWEEAELVKYYDNAFHAVKVTFANEMGAIAKAVGVDARRVADIFCADTALNISTRYLRPGFAFGGSCLPKDLRAMIRQAALRNVAIPMLEATLESNGRQVDELVVRVMRHQPERVGIVGLAFKPQTDDLRESPYLTVAKRLLGEGVQVRVYDPAIIPARLTGKNKAVAVASFRHIESMLVASVHDLNDADTLLINHPMVDERHILGWLREGKRVMDLAGALKSPTGNSLYEGIAW